jgi:O-antigen ligase
MKLMKARAGWGKRLHDRLEGWQQAAFYQGFCQALWAAAIVLLPITSLPWLRKLSGASTVAPPSAVCLLLLAAAWLLPYLARGGRAPLEGTPFLWFGAVVVLTWALSFFLEVPSFRSRGALTEAPQAFLTLAIGMAAFLVSAAWLSGREAQLRLTLQLVNWSGLLLIAWSLLQAFFIFFAGNEYPDGLLEIQRLISSRRMPLYPGRVTGLAYEPSWLAHQLNMVYLPLWLAATLQGTSAHRARLWRFSFENFLLPAGVFVLLISESRVGVLSFMLVVAFLAVGGTLRLVQRIHGWIASRLRLDLSRPRLARISKIVLSMALLAAFAIVYLAGAVGLFFFGARFDERIARALESDPRQAGGLLELTNQFAFAERVVYWSAGLQIFADHPFFGVGLGNAGLYFPEKMPVFGWGLMEITLLLNYRANVANTKSLWVRILAETGLAGFAVFLAWYFLLWQSGRLTRRSGTPLLRTFGLGGQLVLVGFLTEGFSLDSFALPYFWLAAGMAAAAAALARRKRDDSEGWGTNPPGLQNRSHS